MARAQKSFRVAQDVVDLLDQYARREGESQTRVVEAAVREYVGARAKTDDAQALRTRIVALNDALQAALQDWFRVSGGVDAPIGR